MQPSSDAVLKTVADELFDLVKKTKRISVEEVAKKLRIPVANAQALVDFLVEEKIFGIEYKFTTPYVYLYKEGDSKFKEKSSLLKELVTKEQFYKKAKEKYIHYEHIEGLWKKYLQRNLAHIREEFSIKAREKRVPEERIEELWNQYLSYL